MLIVPFANAKVERLFFTFAKPCDGHKLLDFVEKLYKFEQWVKLRLFGLKARTTNSPIHSIIWTMLKKHVKCLIVSLSLRNDKELNNCVL